MPRLVFALLAVLAFFGLGSNRAQADYLLPDGFESQELVSGLSQPIDIEFLPDGRMLVLERQTANVVLVAPGSFTATTIATIADVTGYWDEQGLLGVAVDPAWPTKPYLYFHYTHVNDTNIYLTRYTAVGDLASPAGTFSLTDRYDILTDLPSPHPGHNGGTVEFGIDDMLYMSVGDGWLTHCSAQDSTSLRGCIFRLDVDGLPAGPGGPPTKAEITPPDNPFVGPSPEASLVFCYGLRNPWRFSVNPNTGSLLIGDVGRNEGEEINEAFGGENFGWPFRQGTQIDTFFTDCTEPGGPGGSTYDDPVYWYDTPISQAVLAGPVYAPTGGVFDFPPEYHGALFFGDWVVCVGPNNGHPCGPLRVLVPDSTGAWALIDSVAGQYNAENWSANERFVADFEVGPHGALYYAEQFTGSFGASLGAISRIVPEGTTTGVNQDPVPVRPLLAWPNPVPRGKGVRIGFQTDHPGVYPVAVFDARGRRVAGWNHEAVGSGPQTVPWDGVGPRGRRVPAGAYYFRILGLPGGTGSGRILILP